MTAKSENGVIGILAEFDSAEALRCAIKGMRASPSPPEMEAFSPYPVEEIDSVLGRPRSRIPLAMFIAAVIGATTGYGLQYFASAVAYPLNVGGRPLHSWPAFVPVTFELTILFSALTGFFGWLFACRLPKPYHPVFNAAQFSSASQDGFFLLAYAPEGETQREAIQRQLEGLRPLSITRLYA